jgi:hypothetical protein
MIIYTKVQYIHSNSESDENEKTTKTATTTTTIINEPQDIDIVLSLKNG